MSEENVALLRTMYGRRTLAEFAASLHPEAELHQEPSIPDGADYYGRDDFVRGTALWLEEWEVFNYEPEDLVDLGEQALARIRLSGRAKASGVELDQVAFHVWTFRDGKPWRCEVYFDEAQALQAAGLRE
jgi:ketosteroid isomerase-like protein